MSELGEITTVEVINTDGTKATVKLKTIGIKREPKQPEPQEPTPPAEAE